MRFWLFALGELYFIIGPWQYGFDEVLRFDQMFKRIAGVLRILNGQGSYPVRCYQT
jgi:hypothetical protein